MGHSAISDYVAHGCCLLWKPALIWLHVISDIITGIAYYVISFALLYFVHKKRDMPFLGLFILFGVFVVACGTTHFLAAFTIYVPAYWFEGAVKAFTAVVSIVAAFLFIPVIPQAIAMPSVTRSLEKIKELNAALEAELKEKTELVNELIEVKNRLRTVFDFSTIGEAIASPQKGWIELNAAMCNMFGYSKEELMSITWVELTHPEDIELSTTQFNRMLEGAFDSYTIDKRFIRKDGSVLHVTVWNNCKRRTDGSVEYVVSIVNDITEKKRIEEEIVIERDKLQSIMGAMEDGIYIVNKEHDIEFVNPVITRDFGDVHGRKCYKYFHDRTEPCQWCKNDEVFSGKSVSWEWHSLKNNKVYSLFDTPMRNADGSISKFEILHDITQRKRMEDDLRRFNVELQAMVDVEIQKRQQQEQLLIQQSKMAAMGEMIGLIGHQWRQPINAIALTIQDIKEAYAYGELNEEYITNTTDTTMNQVNFMSKTIDDFRDFFKPSKEMVRFDVKAAIEELLSMFGVMFKKSDVDISIRAEQDAMLFTDGYPNEFKQVVLNILNNAKDAIASKQEAGSKIDGRVEIHIGNENGKIIVSMRDNGGGIPDDVIGNIFNQYYTTKGETGTGLGLYMSKTIIETNMGGSLKARNVDGGAEFVIALGIRAGDNESR